MSREKADSGGGLSAKTLLLAGAASAITAIVGPLLWRPGTLIAAALTPIIVALVTEALRRPVDTVSAVTVRSTEKLAPASLRGRRAPETAEETFDPLAPPTAEDLSQLSQRGQPPPRRVERRRRRLTPRQWKLGIVTGLVAFLGAAAVVTASELAIFGDSVSTGRDRTSLFGGQRNDSRSAADEEETATPTPSATETPEETETPTPTATPTETPTPEETPAATPTPAAVPQEATPAPSVAAPEAAAPTPAP